MSGLKSVRMKSESGLHTLSLVFLTIFACVLLLFLAQYSQISIERSHVWNTYQNMVLVQRLINSQPTPDTGKSSGPKGSNPSFQLTPSSPQIWESPASATWTSSNLGVSDPLG